MFVVLGVPPWPGSGEKAGATQPTFKGRGMRLNLRGKDSQNAMGIILKPCLWHPYVMKFDLAVISCGGS